MGAGKDVEQAARHGHDMLTPGQYAEIARMIESAERMSGLSFSIFIGELPGGRSGALDRHAQLAEPDRTVLVAVDPVGRRCEVVTGATARIGLTDHACQLAILSMTSSFVAGDLIGGLRDGMVILGEQGHQPPVLHLDGP